MDAILLDPFDGSPPFPSDLFSSLLAADSFDPDITVTGEDSRATNAWTSPLVQTVPSATGTKPKRQALACLNCRPKKIKCQRVAGSCSRCRKFGLQCIQPTMDARSKSRSNHHVRLHELEKDINEYGAGLEDVRRKIGRDASSTSRSYGDDGNTRDEEVASDSLQIAQSAYTAVQEATFQVAPVQGPSDLFKDKRGHVRLFGAMSAPFMMERGLNDIIGWRHLISPPDDHPLADEIPQHLQNYLLDHYWRYQNTILQIVHKEAFLEDFKAGRRRYYSKALLYAIFACAARTSCHMQVRRLAFSADEPLLGTEPYFLRKATSLIDEELNDAGITTVQCLQLLSLVHCCRSDHTKGWLESGRAIRLSFELGLHRQPSSSQAQQLGLSTRDLEVRQVVFWGCFEYDRLWSLYLGRPYAIKIDDITVPKPGYQSPSLQISAAWIDLLDILSQIVEAVNKEVFEIERLCALERQLRTWKTRLEEMSHRKTSNSAISCLLHLQYYSAWILLQRPVARFDITFHEGFSRHLSLESRDTCIQNAIRIVNLVEDCTARRENLNTMLGTLLWSITLAAIIFVAGQTQQQSELSISGHTHHIQICIRALKELGLTYNIARVIRTQLKASLQRHSASVPSSDIEAIRDASLSIQNDFPTADFDDAETGNTMTSGLFQMHMPSFDQ